MEEEEVMVVRNPVRRTNRNPANLVKIVNLVKMTRVAQRAVMLARKAVVAAGVAGLTHPSQAAPLLLQGMFIRF